jgi:sigma-B regulation protein RsbU (phosphoserine phosphatase)
VAEIESRELERLRALTESFALLSSSLDLKTVLRNTLARASELTRAKIASIALVNEEGTHLIFLESTDPAFDRLKELSVPVGQGIAGSVARTGQPVRVADVHQDPRFYGKIDAEMGGTTQSYLCVPLIVRQQIIGTAQLMNRTDGVSFSEQDEELMVQFGAVASQAIYNARAHEIMLKQQAIDTELEVCAEIQAKLFPGAPPSFPGFEISGKTIPCREVGGDYYTYIMRKDSTCDVVIADVSGKGLAAALMVSELHSGFHLVSPLPYDLESAINIVNQHLISSFIEGKFVTMFCARLEQNGEMQYMACGHDPPFVIRRGTLLRLEPTGMVLGMPGSHLSSARFTLEPGDLVVAFTDGYSEAMNAQSEQLTEDRIAAVALELAGRPLAEIAEQIDAETRAHRNGVPAADDATLLLFRRL